MYALTQNCVSAGFASDADCRFLPAIESNGAQWIAAHRASARSTERAARACRAAYGRGTRAAAPAGLTYDACQGLILITALHDNRIPIFLPPKGAKS